MEVELKEEIERLKKEKETLILERDQLMQIIERHDRKEPKCKAINCSNPRKYQGYCDIHKPYC